MQRYHLYIKSVLLAALVSAAGCKKSFLDETLTTARGTSFFTTDAGIQQLAVGTYYQVFANPCNGEWFYAATNYGTDEFHVGGDPSNAPWNNYDATFNSVNQGSNTNVALANYQWDAIYIGIGDANLLIQNCISSSSTSAAIKNTALGEGYFMRAYSYLRLVSQYGAVPLQLTPITTVQLEFTRASPKEVYAQIISDLTKAMTLLPTSGSPYRITQDAAAHFLAKAYLSRASEINSSWNSDTKAADLAAIVPLCDGVIARHPLAQNFASVFNFTGINSANENLPEVILSAQFTNDVNTNQGNGNTQHLYFVSRYDIQDQMARDLTGDRPFSRLATTYYMYRVYDMVNDSRFWKSFRTKSAINGATPVAPNKQGDVGIMFVINQPGDARYPLSKICKTTSGTALVNDVNGTGRPIPTTYVAYPAGRTTDGALNTDLTTAGQSFPSCSKHMDGSRNALNDVVGHRDFILARSAETYLIAAEAKIRLAQAGTGSYTDALPYINAVRTRAQYAGGESRSAYNDGGNTLQSVSLQTPGVGPSFYPGNSYYESNNIPVTTAASSSLAIGSIAPLPAQDEYIINALGLSNTYDRMLCLVLNERSRELVGEYKRWEDLSRTQTLVKRVQVFNPEGSPNIKAFHSLRPIPQTFLDGIQAGGVNLTAGQKQAMQNPGY
ncbi:RagB/SusD family nutrient uptake outer membrane protein [Flavisolibacter ginsenosidimutans]|uniref:RagB/SusD family nutrient uptake outer membrane protein n=1 Tax=Flavisolibacter ginsenosidimutans TaxID=661481 RepID=A0A5B8UNW2_9BACT|nr:RagB/SusD family nutrient uptake outer membrane protein [Flavisolibacter ginsenosidimutans]QEC58263.1 RagB/SusD family nutrient uptake outer membrane protein [Flavisolibacter ginsenosidimutans]